MKHHFLSCTVLAIMAALVLSSCTTVDLGGAVDNLGREVPVSQDYARMDKHHQIACYTAADGHKYLEFQVQYHPARAKYFHCFMVGGCPVEAFTRFYPAPYAKTEIWYGEVEGDRLCSITRMIPEAEFSTAGMTHSLITLPDEQKQFIICHSLPERRNPLNTAVQPLRWVAEVVDVPLSILATPVNWLLLPTGHSLWTL